MYKKRKAIPEKIITIEAITSGVVGARLAAMNPDRIAGMACANAWTEADMPMISPLASAGADFERRAFKLAIDNPVKAEKSGGMRNICHAYCGRKYARTITPPPISEYLRIVASPNFFANFLVSTADARGARIKNIIKPLPFVINKTAIHTVT